MSEVIYKGLTWSRILTVTTAETGARVDLTGSAITFRVRKHSPPGNPLVIDCSIGDGIELLDQSNPATKGQAAITVDGAASLAIETGIYTAAATVTPSGLAAQPVLPPFKLPIRDTP